MTEEFEEKISKELSDIMEKLLHNIESENKLSNIERLTFTHYKISEDTTADILLIYKTGLVGIKIKSTKDDFSMIERQVNDYKSICNAFYIVATANHVNDALNQPAGVIIARNDEFILIRSDSSPVAVINKEKLAQLLYEDELLELLTELGFTKIKNKNKLELAKFWADENLPANLLYNALYERHKYGKEVK